MPAIVEPTIPSDVKPDRAVDIPRWCRVVAGFFDRYPLEVTISKGAETADVIRWTLQVTDRRGRVALGPFVVHLWVSAADTGVPGGSQTVTVVTGSALDTHTANVRYTVLTSATGLIELDIEVTGSGDRTVYAEVRPAPQSMEGSWQ